MTDTLAAYYQRIAKHQLAPLWERLADLLPAEPCVASVPYRWDYAALRDLLLESAALIAEDEAERRVLILENPGLPGSSAITEALFAGLQLIMPGEIAPAHRHSMGALRFILESDAAYTSVDGEPLPMARGDFIVTPSWTWHDHTHRGSRPVVWLDVLDLPAVRALGPRFAAHHPTGRPVGNVPSGQSLRRYGSNMRPVGGADGAWKSPLRYPYARAREAIAKLARQSELDAYDGIKLEYLNPTDGSAALPTLSAYLQLLPDGFEGRPYRTTEGLIYCVVEGRGTLRVGGGQDTLRFDYKPDDILAVPCWAPHAFTAERESVIFSASDRAIQVKLGLWREQRGN